MCDDCARACESSFWDLLEPELQHCIIELALELRKSEAREKYQTIRCLDWLWRHEHDGLDFNEDMESTFSYDLIVNLTNELQKLVREIGADEQCLGALRAEENDEMAQLQASLQKIITPEPLVFDFGDLDLEAMGL